MENGKSFEEVLPEIKKGRKARRAGWNGKNMFIFRQPGYPEGVPEGCISGQKAGLQVARWFPHFPPEGRAESAWPLMGARIGTAFCGVANAADNRVCHFCGRDLDSEEARQARARKLPAMVDGELIAVESDGQREEIRERAERIKAEQAEADRAREKKREAGGCNCL